MDSRVPAMSTYVHVLPPQLSEFPSFGRPERAGKMSGSYSSGHCGQTELLLRNHKFRLRTGWSDWPDRKNGKQPETKYCHFFKNSFIINFVQVPEIYYNLLKIPNNFSPFSNVH